MDTLAALFRDLVGERFGLPNPLPADPFPTLVRWFDEAKRAAAGPDPDAMTLATATPGGRPSARIVLCKSIDPTAGSLVFFSHREGRKGRELAANPRAAVVYHWNHQARQARVEGPVALLDDAASDAYFAGRPLLSKLGAWASRQSEPLGSRGDLLEAVREAARRFGIGWTSVLGGDVGARIPRPPGWGGFVLTADAVELWQGGSGRLHDRALWTREHGPAGRAGPWSSTRLYP